MTGADGVLYCMSHIFKQGCEVWRRRERGGHGMSRWGLIAGMRLERGGHGGHRHTCLLVDSGEYLF